MTLVSGVGLIFNNPAPPPVFHPVYNVPVLWPNGDQLRLHATNLRVEIGLVVRRLITDRPQAFQRVELAHPREHRFDRLSGVRERADPGAHRAPPLSVLSCAAIRSPVALNQLRRLSMT